MARRERLAGARDAFRSSFGAPAALAMVVGLVAGFAMPELDRAFDVELPLFDFDTQDAARSLLGTVAGAAVSVAGLTFSTTLVAFTLASSQLSPRVLRTFRRDGLGQATLAALLATFIYCLAVLIRLGSATDPASSAQTPVPNLSISLATLLAFLSLGLLALFIGHIVHMLQPSAIIAGITSDAVDRLDHRFPAGVGGEPDDRARSVAEAHERAGRDEPWPVRSRAGGYLTMIRGDALLAAASEDDLLLRQTVPVGDYVLPGEVLAEVWGHEVDGRGDELCEAFELGAQRSQVQDIAFALRQLADIALKGLSPGINDPTTAENAMDAAAAILVRVARADQPAAVRVDADGRARLVAAVPTLDDLIRLAFEQVRVFAAPYPVFSVHLVGLLERVAAAARRAGVPQREADRQAALIRQGPDGEVPTVDDVARVRGA